MQVFPFQNKLKIKFHLIRQIQMFGIVMEEKK